MYPTNRKQSTAGFTLIEMLVIAPLVILIIGAFVGAMVSLVGDVLVTRDRNAMTYESQDALNRIEQDIRLSTQFLTTTGTLTAPQGSSSNFTGTAAFTNGNDKLILNTLATTTNPTDTNRSLVYYANQPNACGTQQSFNRVLLMQVVYFIKDNSLWRRTILPNYNTNAIVNGETVCNSPWQRNTCSPGYAPATRCQTNDAEIMKNVGALGIKYYLTPDTTSELAAASAKDALTVEATLSGSKTTAGQSVAATGTMRATRLNNIDTSIPPPTAPTLSHTLPTGTSVKFSWTSVSVATSYEISYNINGGSWVNSSVSTNTTSFTVNANREDTVTFRIAAKNASGTSATITDSATLPRWTELDLLSGWKKYSDTYNTPSYTRTSSGRVFLKGLVKDGTATSGTVIAKLPEGYRPSGRLVFPVSTSPNINARVDVDLNGDVILYRGTNTWTSLDGISFLPSDTPYTWNTMSFYNGWTNWDPPTYEPLHVALDNRGRVNMQGLIRAGTQTNNTPIAYLNPAFFPPKSLHFPAGSSSVSLFWLWYADGEVTKRGTQTSTYLGMQALWYPGSTGSWTTIEPDGTWAQYAGNYPNFQYTKASDGVVTLRGLIKSGPIAATTKLGNLPAGYRPEAVEVMTTLANEDYARIDIEPDGDLIIRSVSNNTWLALNYSFVADQ